MIHRPKLSPTPLKVEIFGIIFKEIIGCSHRVTTVRWAPPEIYRMLRKYMKGLQLSLIRRWKLGQSSSSCRNVCAHSETFFCRRRCRPLCYLLWRANLGTLLGTGWRTRGQGCCAFCCRNALYSWCCVTTICTSVTQSRAPC